MKLVYIALAWAAGIVTAARAETPPLLMWLVLALLALATIWLAHQMARGQLAAVVLAAFALGGLRLALQPSAGEVASYNGVGGLTIDGLIVEAPQVRDDQVQIRVAAETVTRAGET